MGYDECKILDFLSNKGYFIAQTQDKIDGKVIAEYKFDFLISYGYRYIIKENILSLFGDNAINLHISYLPWNKGADPNFWSIIENTKKGVTIHILDNGLDTGDIIFQKEVEFNDQDTLATSYDKLKAEIENLFIKNWKNIVSKSYKKIKQLKGGSYHTSKEKNIYLPLLSDGWNTKINDLKKIINLNK